MYRTRNAQVMGSSPISGSKKPQVDGHCVNGVTASLDGRARLVRDRSGNLSASSRIMARVRGTKRQRRPGVWELRVYIGNDPKSGNPVQVSKTFRGGAREADAALRELID